MSLERNMTMENLQVIEKAIREAGGNLYLVGGALRDELLGKTSHDKDYCITGLDAKDFEKLFPDAKIRGKSFAVYIIDGNEFAMARTELKNGKGHKAFEIKTDKNITIDQDLARRDITINSMAKDVLTNELIDPFNGKYDLDKKIIRATTTHFKEDPLRVYRVARFSASLGFTVEENTLKMMKELKNELDTLSKERVFEELKKALLTQTPSIFFDVLKKADVLDIHFKEINDLIGAEQPIKYHPEGDAYNHTMLTLDKVAQLTTNFEENRKLEIRFSALVHDLGKGITPKEMYPHHYGHEQNGAKLVNIFGNRIKVPNRWIRCGKTACLEHMRGGIFYNMKPNKQVEFLERVDKSILGLDGLQIIVIGDKTSGERGDSYTYFENIGRECLNTINGEYIKNKYGKLEGLEMKQKLHDERIKWIKDHK